VIAARLDLSDLRAGVAGTFCGAGRPPVYPGELWVEVTRLPALGTPATELAFADPVDRELLLGPARGRLDEERGE
jgi:hypothetical protein